MLAKWLGPALGLIIIHAAAAGNGAVEISGAWARATPGKSEIGAAYLTMSSPSGDRLIAVSTPVAQKAEMHTMSMDGGIMKMRAVETIDLPAGQRVTLKPGGLHIMLMGLAQPLHEGQSFPLNLTFEKAGARQVTVSVQKATAVSPPGAVSGEAHGSTSMPMSR